MGRVSDLPFNVIAKCWNSLSKNWRRLERNSGRSHLLFKFRSQFNKSQRVPRKRIDNEQSNVARNPQRGRGHFGFPHSRGASVWAKRRKRLRILATEVESCISRRPSYFRDANGAGIGADSVLSV